MRCGLLGKKLGHSYSPQIHSYLGDYTYDLFEITPDALPAFLQNGNFTGLNVTIPYKKEVLPYCDKLSERASQLGSVNTIVRSKDGKLIGHNTDYFGFESMVARTGLQVQNKKVLVLGTGGASVTAVAVLQAMGANVVVISRTGVNNYSNLYLHNDTSVIVNATPVGMYPNTGETPLDISVFPQLEGVLDIIYNPARTQLLLDAQERGLITENGLWMLVAQAKESSEWFTNTSIPDDKISEIHQVIKSQMENIVLIGMPGCGKSTIGRILAEKLGKRFVDADAEIESISGLSIPQIFANEGEDGFRRRETLVLSELGKQSGLVLATGGGCVTRPENYSLLHQNGYIVWIQRDLNLLPTDGRPLSHKDKLSQMYAVRKPLYQGFSDAAVINNGSIDDLLNQILQLEDIQ